MGVLALQQNGMPIQTELLAGTWLAGIMNGSGPAHQVVSPQDLDALALAWGHRLAWKRATVIS
jgi:hypothetical protein